MENPDNGLEGSLEKFNQKNVMGFDIHDSKNAASKIVYVGALFGLLAAIGLKYMPHKRVLPAIRASMRPWQLLILLTQLMVRRHSLLATNKT
jgi:Na+/citrate or Na+/malate symporter